MVVDCSLYKSTVGPPRLLCDNRKKFSLTYSHFMNFYSWLSIFMLAQAVNAFVNIHRLRSRAQTVSNPEWNGTIDRRSNQMSRITCISVPNEQLPSVTLLRDLASKFCSYVESHDSISRDDPVERSYLINKTWYSLSFELRPPIELFEKMSSSNTPLIEADECKKEFENIWRACKASISKRSSI